MAASMVQSSAMDPQASFPSLALRGSSGIWMINGKTFTIDQRFPQEVSRECKVMTFSKDGSLFAWCNGVRVAVKSLITKDIVLQLDLPSTSDLEISPCNSILVTWQPYIVTKDIAAGTPNLNIWDIKSGKLLRGFVQKKALGSIPQWTNDEGVVARSVNNEIHFFEKNNFETTSTKLHLQKVADFSLSKAGPPYKVAAYVPGTKGQPSFVRLYQYPNFGGPNSALANKSFYQADRIEMHWNEKGTAVLLQTFSDTSADSYYGDQGLHYVSVNGESCLVPRAKNGPIYSAVWNPDSTNFCVVYGFMPAKATLYNLKCEPVFDFGTGPRNLAFYNPQGTTGFGNLRGKMEFWDMVDKQLISSPQAPDTTHFGWCPDGEHYYTATTAPRLRVGNGYKIWHCTGDMLHEQDAPSGHELWEAQWQPAQIDFRIKIRHRAGKSAPGAKKETKPAAYVPPALRGNPGITLKPFREAYEPASNVKQAASQAETTENLSKAALKNRKRKEAKSKAKQEKQGEEEEMPGQMLSQSQPVAVSSTGNPETDKKIRNVRKKLQAIEKLKQQQAEGKELEKNQLDKVKTESSLLQELASLQIS